MKKSDSFGVDAPYVEAAVTPFVSDSARIFDEAENEAIEKEPRGGTLLRGPDTSTLGPEKGRLNRLHTQYSAAPTLDNLNQLLAEVERYARRVTSGKGGAFSKYISQSVTDKYPVSEISASVTMKVWRNLEQFDGRSKFSNWVYRIAHNVVKDKCRAIIDRGEVELLDWKDYSNEGSGCYRTIPGSSMDGEFEIKEGAKIALPCGGGADQRVVKLEQLMEKLKPFDKRLIQLVVYHQHTPRELGDKFGKNAKWASNNLNRIKKTLKKLARTEGVANTTKSNVIVMKSKTLPASQAA